MTQKAPGRDHRVGITLMQLADLFPDEETARNWFEHQVWPDGVITCPRCGSHRTHPIQNRNSPYRCSRCRRHFSVKTGTALARSRVALRQWVFALYLETTHVKGIASMKLHRDIGVTPKTAWFMLHRIREAWTNVTVELDGSVEIDEACIGGLERNRHEGKKLRKGRGGVGKARVVAMRERDTDTVVATVVDSLTRKTRQGPVHATVKEGSTVCTDGNTAYAGVAGHDHKAVNHSGGRYVRSMAHTNGVESVWALLKRAHMGTHHRLSRKHLARGVQTVAGRRNDREADTLARMQAIAAGLIGRQLLCRELIAD